MFRSHSLAIAAGAAVLFALCGAAPAQSLFDDFGEPAWLGAVGYSRGVNIEPDESSAVLAQIGFARQGQIDFGLFAGQLTANDVDIAILGGSAEFFLRPTGSPFVPSLLLQVTRSSPSGTRGQNLTAVQVGGAGTLIADLAENIRVLPSMAVSVSKAFPDPNERGEFETIMIVHLGATLFMKTSDWKPTGVFFAPAYSISDGDAALSGTIGFSIGL